MKIVEVSAAIIHDGKEVFVTQRGYGEFKDGWEFPGGKIEVGESKEKCIVREIREELGIQIVIEKYLGFIEYDYPTFHLKMHAFLCAIQEGELLLREHEDAKYVSVENLGKVDFLPADVLLIDSIQEALSD